MPVWVNLIVGLAASALIIASIRTALDFRSHCERTARREARTAEFADMSSDENSLNGYEREQYSRLMHGQFSGDPGEELAIQEYRLAKRMKRLRFATFAFIVAIAMIYWK